MRWGYQTTVACDGSQAWDLLNVPDPPRLAILDWMMPGMSGVDVRQLVRKGGRSEYLYIILLTARGRMEDIIEGMNAGADDYITKPFDSGELKVRLRAAKRILDLQAELIARARPCESKPPTTSSPACGTGGPSSTSCGTSLPAPRGTASPWAS